MINDKDIIYLIACAINNKNVDEKIVEKMDLGNIYDFFTMQRISACLYPVLKDASNVNIESWKVSYSKNQKTMMLMDEERDKLYKFFDKNKIWHMPLKGLIVRDYYPTPAMREMSDNDILFDKHFENDVRKYMKKEGYKTQSDYRNIDCKKKPCYHFEIHMNCYVEGDNPTFLNYYKNIEGRLIKDSLNYKFTKEDFYIYQVCHHYNHNQDTGTGLRPLMDTYVYLKNNNLNFDYVDKEMKKLQISDFEILCRNLANKRVSNPEKFPKLKREESEYFEKAMLTSAYGSVKPVLEKRFKDLSESNTSLIRYMFPPYKFFEERHVRFTKHKALLPYYWIVYNYRRVKAYGIKDIKEEYIKYKKRKK